MMRQPVEKRFFNNKFIKLPNNGCWIWHAAKGKAGYGLIHPDSWSVVTAHRLSYKIHIGPIPLDMDVCHKCDNRACVNPDHLFLGTAKDNIDDMIKKGRHRYIAHPGEKNGYSRLNNAKVIKIRELKRNGLSHRQLANLFGISISCAWKVSTRRMWKHI